MKFLIQNTTSEDKFITRFGGYKMCVPKYDFIEFDSDDSLECRYWSSLVYNHTNGLNVITDTARIRLLNKMKSCGKYGNVSNNSTVNVPEKVEPIINAVKEEEVETPVEDVKTVVETVVEPVAETPVVTEPETVEEVTEEVNEETTTDEEVTVDEATVDGEVTEEVTEDEVTTEETTSFTEEELTTKTKEELFAILDTYSIKYKKNYSVSRLINMILENCK